MAKSFNARMQSRFATITTNGDKQNKYIHETAMIIAKYAQEQIAQGNYDSVSFAQTLIMTMPASMRRETLIEWFKRYTPIVVKNDEKWVAQAHKPDTKLYVPFDLEKGDSEPFYEIARKNKEPKGPLAADALLAAIKRMADQSVKAADEGKTKPEDVDYIRAIAAALSKIKVKRPTPAPSNDEQTEAVAA